MTFLSKEKLTEELNKHPMIAQHLDCMDVFDAINESVVDDVIQIVRCKDCVNNGTSRCPCHYSGDPYIDWNPDDDWFCADGEAKT